MTVNFNAKQRQYETHKASIDAIMLQSITQEAPTCKKNTLKLESDLDSYLGSERTVVCNTQFNAFLLLFTLVELKSGDEVITSTLGSGIAVQAALFMGAKVVFVDVNEDDFTLDVEQVEDAITERTKLIIPISLFGRCADMSRINDLALQNDLCVIEDAAESFGSRQDNTPSCHLSKLATTSFYPDMPLHGFGNGAALFIEDDALRQKAKVLRSQGREGEEYREIGIEACMDEVQAGMVDFKLAIYNEEMQARHRLVKNYAKHLSTTPIQMPTIDIESNAAYYPLVVSERVSLQERLKSAGIETKIPFYKPLHLHDAFLFMRYVAGDFPISERLSKQLLLLPLNAYLTQEDQDYIIQTLLERI